MKKIQCRPVVCELIALATKSAKCDGVVSPASADLWG